MPYARGGKLAFLETILATGAQRYETATWLHSDFKAMLWKCNFGPSGSFNLDFGSLISQRVLSQEMVTLIKYWLVICTGSATPHALERAPAGQYFLLNTACAWIDYLILNDDYFLVLQNGFSLLTPDAFQGALDEICAHTHRSTSIYDFPTAVIGAAQDGASQLDAETIENILNSSPALRAQHEGDLPNGLQPRNILDMRAWLHREGLLKWKSQKYFKLDSAKIGTALFSNTLRGAACSWPILEIFTNIRDSHRSRKYAAVRTTSRGESIIGRSASERAYLGNIKSFKQVKNLGLGLNLLPPDQTVEFAHELVIGERTSGRFKSLPADVVFIALRGAIELCEIHGDAVIDSYIALVEKINRTTNSYEQLGDTQITSCIDAQLQEQGVLTWAGSVRKRDGMSRYSEAEIGADVGPNLHRHLKVLYGATNIIVGTLMARRQVELINLESSEALDGDAQNLIFRNAKSTALLGGLQEREARPIMAIAAKAITRLQRLHRALRGLGYLAGSSKLLQYPSQNEPQALVKVGPKALNTCIDSFCDHIGTPFKDGKRYYIREHQLRRFFCMVFFWHRSFAGLDTLRWFLGHHDIEALYRYITESTPGAVLRNSKSQYTVENLSSYTNLREYLAARFGIGDFTLIDNHKLEIYVYMLQEEGSVSIEPIFFRNSSGQDYRMVVKVLDNGRQNGS